jgi:glycosyltransferase involved in cell wall biosynthesis
MIVFVHLLNDASGSPRVLKSVISSLRNSETKMILYIGSDGSGFLSESEIEIRKFWYKRSRLKLITLFSYLSSQFILFVRLMASNDIDRQALIYVNTMLPFGAALYGWLTGRRVIFHLHETSITPAPLKHFLVGVVRLTSKLNIYVSDAHRTLLPIPSIPSRRLYNCIDQDILAVAACATYFPRRDGVFIILLIASLRDYKGVPEYLELARSLELVADTQFELLVNGEQLEVDRYFRGLSVPKNLKVIPRVSDPAPFYNRASLLLNLSRTDMWIETFGLTILEAMAFGVPVIAPPVGGPVEIVRNGVEGFIVDSRKSCELIECVNALRLSDDLCMRMSSAARARAMQFTPDIFTSALRETINQMDAA